MSLGSFSQDPLFQAFSTASNNSTSDDAFEQSLIRSPISKSITPDPVLKNENFPTGSRLFAYMQPAQVSRKSSRSSTDAQSNLAASPSSPPQFTSNMSPYANSFQPSSSTTTKYYNQAYNLVKNIQSGTTLEQKFTDSVTMNDLDHRQHHQRQHQGPIHAASQLNHSLSTPAFQSLATANMLHYAAGTGSDLNIGGIPTPPNSSTSIPMNDGTGLRAKMVKQTTVSYAPGSPANVAAESIGGTTYFFNSTPSEGQTQEPPGTHDRSLVDAHQRPALVTPEFYVYTGPLANVAHLRTRGGVGSTSYFAPNELKQELMERQLLCMAQVDSEAMPDVPQETGNYHRLVPLDMPFGMMPERPGYFGVPTSVFKAISTKDGLAYCLRRIHNYRMTNMRCLSVLDAWKKLQHSNVVHIREMFTTKAFGDNSLVFVYDYYPNASTVKAKHFGRPLMANGFGGTSIMDGLDIHRFAGPPRIPKPRGMPDGLGQSPPGVGAIDAMHGGLLPESLIWCYVIQLSSALRQIHSAGLAARTIEPSKILIMGKSRLLINCCGLFDMLTFDQQQPAAVVQHHQQEDLLNFGRVVLALACNSPMAAMRDQWNQSIDFVARHYSPDLKNLILYLMAVHRPRNVNDVMPMIGARFYTQLESSQNRIDMLENELTKEIDNGRLFRLLSKFGAVNERPEFAMDPQWSETGDRFLLKLFRDYLFHQVTEDGRPWLDLAHVVQCLNKLDAGVKEKITLSSRDQQNVLVVSYADLHRCLNQAFGELSRASNAGTGFTSTATATSIPQEQFRAPSNPNP